MKNKILLFSLMAFLCFASCDNREETYELGGVYVGETVGFSIFSDDGVKICVDNHFNFYDRSEKTVEFAFVKHYVYRIQMINKIPDEGWTDTIERIHIQDGYVARLLRDDGTYEYARFYVYNIDFDQNAKQFVLCKYQSNISL